MKLSGVVKRQEKKSVFIGLFFITSSSVSRPRANPTVCQSVVAFLPLTHFYLLLHRHIHIHLRLKQKQAQQSSAPVGEQCKKDTEKKVIKSQKLNKCCALYKASSDRPEEEHHGSERIDQVHRQLRAQGRAWQVSNQPLTHSTMRLEPASRAGVGHSVGRSVSQERKEGLSVSK